MSITQKENILKRIIFKESIRQGGDNVSKESKKCYFKILAVVFLLLIGSQVTIVEGKSDKELKSDTISGKQFAESNGWIYYFDFENGDKLCKERFDGTEKTILSKYKSKEIIAKDDCIYYIDNEQRINLIENNMEKTIFDINRNGTLYKDGFDKIAIDRIILSKEKIYCLVHYYRNDMGTPDGKIVRIKKDGTIDRIYETKGVIWNMVIQGDWICYYGTAETGGMYKIKTDGSDNTDLMIEKITKQYICQEPYFIPNENKILVLTYRYNENIYISDFNIYDLESSKLTTLNFLKEVGSYIYKDNWVYYIKNESLYKVRIDGVHDTKLYEGNKRNSYIQLEGIVGDWVYFSEYSNEPRELYRIKINGIDKQLIMKKSKNKY